MKASKKTVKAARKTVTQKTDEKPITRPGRNGGRLNAGPGPGRPKDPPEVKAQKQLVKTAQGECSDILQELIENGELRKFMRDTIQKQAQAGRIDALRWLCEYTEPPTAPGTPRDPSELLETLISELERTA